MDNMLIDGLEYVNWNRDLFEKAHAAGLTAIHATLVYWEDTEESFDKMNYWDDLIQSNKDILMHVKNPATFLLQKKHRKLVLFMVFKILHLLQMILI